MRAMLPLFITLTIILIQSTSSQDAFGDQQESISEVEVTDHEAMEDHGQLMMMMHDQAHGDDSSMEMMGTASMKLRPSAVPINQHESAGMMSSKEQFCLNQMTQCLANPMPFNEHLTQPNVGASETQEYVVDAPTDGGSGGSFEPFASGVNKGTINRVKKKKPQSANLMNMDEETQESIRCNGQNFIRMSECCSNTPGDFFTGAILFACSDVFPINPGIVLKEYNLNMGLLQDNSLDLSRSDTMSGEVLGNGVCFIDCIFRKRSLISEDGAIDYTMVAHHFMSSVMDRAWHPVVMQSIRNCSQVMHKFPQQMMNPDFSYQKFCFTHPYLFQQCVMKSLRMVCPLPNHRTNSPECVEKRRFLQRCDIFQKRFTVPRH
ncbi:uncharacterized protein LOC132196851 [Neocloeon triangulifer]|uniref:uncharacterized protein LOC132196851 n=1 Tax=Neocloeon triangulifer TaxID=2078957 RepID=UPI00286F07D7|nr:uncharacterized protein LOC132196851 [Neocloeon triangulifer]